MKNTLWAGTVLLMTAGMTLGHSADAPSGKTPPITSNPACTWSKAKRGEWLCQGYAKLAPGEGDLERQGHCGTMLQGSSLIVTSFNVEIASPLDPVHPIYLVGLYLNRELLNTIIIGGTFLSDKTRPENVYCSFKVRVKVR